MTIELQDLMQLVDNAQSEGAVSAEVFFEEIEGLDVDVVRGRPSKTPVASRKLEIGVWTSDNHHAAVTGDPDDGDELVDRALAQAAKGGTVDRMGPIERLPMTTRGLGIDDRRFPRLDENDRLDVIVSAERGARGVARKVKTDDFRYEDRQIRRCYASSNDVAVEEKSTTYMSRGTVRVDDLELQQAMVGRTFASISSLPFGVVMANRALGLLEHDDIEIEGPIRVMMPPRVTGALFHKLAHAFRVEPLERGESLFTQGWRSGEPVMDERIHMIDDAQVPGGLHTYIIDEQGVPPVPLVLLREGKVTARYVDKHAASDLEMRPTGHWWGGALRPSNLMLRSGTRSMSALLSEHDDVPTLMLDHVVGWDDLDLRTGDFTVVGTGFYQLGNDKIEGLVRNTTLKGNILEVLNQLVDIASDTDRIVTVDSPGLLVDGMTVA